jgi:hypothetical protein
MHTDTTNNNNNLNKNNPDDRRIDRTLSFTMICKDYREEADQWGQFVDIETCALLPLFNPNKFATRPIAMITNRIEEEVEGWYVDTIEEPAPTNPLCDRFGFHLGGAMMMVLSVFIDYYKRVGWTADLHSTSIAKLLPP